jgi:hypothetical protein
VQSFWANYLKNTCKMVGFLFQKFVGNFTHICKKNLQIFPGELQVMPQKWLQIGKHGFGFETKILKNPYFLQYWQIFPVNERISDEKSTQRNTYMQNSKTNVPEIFQYGNIFFLINIRKCLSKCNLIHSLRGLCYEKHVRCLWCGLCFNFICIYCNLIIK